MPKPTKKAAKKIQLPGIWGIAIFGIFFLILSLGMILEYQNFIWQIFDAFIQNLVWLERRDALTPIVIFITNFGYYGTILIWLVISGILAAAKQWRMFWVCLWLSLGGYGVGTLIKAVISRPRPSDMALVSETMASFPSAHAMTAIILYLTIAYLTYHYSRKFLTSYLTFIFGLIVSLGIGLSRVYLGVHYFSDVVAGFIFGITWLFVVLWVEKSISTIQKKTNKSV